MLESKDLVVGGEVEVVSKDLMLVFSEGILDATRLMNSGLNDGGVMKSLMVSFGMARCYRGQSHQS